MNQYLKIRTNDDGVITISNRRGFTATELYGILAFAQTVIKTTISSVTMDVVSKTETDIKEIRIDDVGISFYDTIN